MQPCTILQETASPLSVLPSKNEDSAGCTIADMSTAPLHERAWVLQERLLCLEYSTQSLRDVLGMPPIREIRDTPRPCSELLRQKRRRNAEESCL